MHNTVDFQRVIRFTGIAMLVAVILNNVWMILYQTISENAFPDVIHFGSVTGASALPIAFAGLFFFLLAKYFGRGKLIFIILASIFMLASLFGPMAPELPDGRIMPQGFAALTVPMHLVAGLSAILFIPRAQQ